MITIALVAACFGVTKNPARPEPGGTELTHNAAGSAKAWRSGGRLRTRSSEEEMTALPAGPLLFDTGVYIRFSRGENYLWLGEDARVFQRTILTAVVAAELYAGTHDQREKRVLDELCKAHRALGHFSSPPAAAWIDAGILLRCARSAYRQMHFARHFRDLLIALEAAQAGATLVTENARDFARWKSLLASTRKTLKLFEPSKRFARG
jgi:predicted nucleic acid-binding protein